MAAILFAEVVYVLAFGSANSGGAMEIGPHAVGLSLFGPYLLGVELAALILLAGLVGAYHLGRRSEATEEKGS
jgi:NADH-quinone oxidoreductase subunit J